jgi:hypothetical protein
MRSEPSTGARTIACRSAPTAAAAVVLASCTVADNLGYDEIVAEVDGIVRVDGSGPQRALSYANTADTSNWYMRQFWLVPFRWLLGVTLGLRSPTELENPSGHVRQLLIELPDETGSDLLRCAGAVERFGWIALLDPSPANRIVAYDGITTVLERLAIPVFARVVEDLEHELAPEVFEAARQTIALLRPEQRPAGPLDAPAAARYVDALGVLAAPQVHRPEWSLGAIRDLISLHAAEAEPGLRAATAASLRTAMGCFLQASLLGAIRHARSPSPEVRLCALELIRRLGGPEVVPLLIAILQPDPSQRARGDVVADPDPAVQLRLVHLCGQLRGELALREFRLPGAEAWQAIAPADFLAQVILTEQRYYPKFRIPALTALTLCVGRPRHDFDLQWVRDWFDERQKSRGA